MVKEKACGQRCHPIFQPSEAAFAGETEEEIVPALEITTEGIDPFCLLGLQH